MQIFKTKLFARYARKNGLMDAMLFDAVADAERGLIDADLGGGVIKQRIARPGAGKSGGYRTIILYRKEGRAVFVYGFAKNERDNMTTAEEKVYKDLATIVLTRTDDQMRVLTEKGDYFTVEVAHE